MTSLRLCSLFLLLSGFVLSAAEPVSKPTAQPAAQPAATPAAQAVAKPTAKPMAQPPRTVFEMLSLQGEIAPLEQQMLMAGRAGNYVRAEEFARQVIATAPWYSSAWYNLACLQALAGRTNEAFATLDKSVTLGFRDQAHIAKDPDLAKLRQDPRFDDLLGKARRPATPSVPATPPITFAPYYVTGAVAWVAASNTFQDLQLGGQLRTLYRFDTDAIRQRPIIVGVGTLNDQLRAWYAAGSAAGNVGDIYDNRDRGHARLGLATYPQMTRVDYVPEAVAVGLDYGVQSRLLHDAVTLGNSSTALTQGFFWRSISRVSMLESPGAAWLYLQYRANQLYLYPEHNDYDPEPAGHGDVFPGNTPYILTSLGSSGSDQPFLNALTMALAAFRPEVKQHLSSKGQLMPALQMVFRRSNRPVTNDAVYLTGIAHPAVFDSTQLDLDRLLNMAHDLTITNLPPLVELKVVSEDRFNVGRDYFDVAERGEMLFTTPCSIARVWRSTARTRRMVVSAAGSHAPDRRPLTFHWSVLCGDPKEVVITPRNSDASIVEITFNWQPRHALHPGSAMRSNRIEIGAFASNGTLWSAPAFISFMTLENERREYAPDGRILSVVYVGGEEAGPYVDPVYDLPKSWRDEYHYGAARNLIGWTRLRGFEKKRRDDYAVDGRRIVARDAAGQPAQTVAVRYVPQQASPKLAPTLKEIEIREEARP